MPPASVALRLVSKTQTCGMDGMMGFGIDHGGISLFQTLTMSLLSRGKQYQEARNSAWCCYVHFWSVLHSLIRNKRLESLRLSNSSNNGIAHPHYTKTLLEQRNVNTSTQSEDVGIVVFTCQSSYSQAMTLKGKECGLPSMGLPFKDWDIFIVW